MEGGDLSGTPTEAASFPGDLTMNHGHPYYLTPGTSTKIILNHPRASANMTDSCARDTLTSCDPPGQSLSPTPAPYADLHNLLPPHTRSPTHAGIILGLPAQQTRAKTSNTQPIHKQPGTPTEAASFPGDLTTNHGHPYYLTPGTSTEIILNHPSASANMTDSCARDTLTSCDPPGQSLSPPTPAASADLHNLLPLHTRNQAHAGIILCLPAQQTRATTCNSQSIRKKPPPKNLASSSKMTDKARSGGIEGEKTIKRGRIGSKRAIHCENSVGNTVPLQSSIPVGPKELTRVETRSMLKDKARTEITRYLGD